jgi:hypothetical protein
MQAEALLHRHIKLSTTRKNKNHLAGGFYFGEFENAKPSMK